jgi:hypothetical protein
VTASGHPRTISERAIQRHNLLVAETVLRTEIPRPTLRDLLELTALIAMKDRGRFWRVAARWLFKYLEAVEGATIDDAMYVAANLGALGGRQHEQALTALREVAEQRSLRVVGGGGGV